jgi:hypothetical protein
LGIQQIHNVVRKPELSADDVGIEGKFDIKLFKSL